MSARAILLPYCPVPGRGRDAEAIHRFISSWSRPGPVDCFQAGVDLTEELYWLAAKPSGLRRAAGAFASARPPAEEALSAYRAVLFVDHSCVYPYLSGLGRLAAGRRLELFLPDAGSLSRHLAAPGWRPSGGRVRHQRVREAYRLFAAVWTPSPDAARQVQELLGGLAVRVWPADAAFDADRADGPAGGIDMIPASLPLARINRRLLRSRAAFVCLYARRPSGALLRRLASELTADPFRAAASWGRAARAPLAEAVLPGEGGLLVPTGRLAEAGLLDERLSGAHEAFCDLVLRLRQAGAGHVAAGPAGPRRFSKAFHAKWTERALELLRAAAPDYDRIALSGSSHGST